METLLKKFVEFKTGESVDITSYKVMGANCRVYFCIGGWKAEDADMDIDIWEMMVFLNKD